MKTIQDCHDYWRSPQDQNQPSEYLKKKNNADMLKVIEKHIDKDCSILELGCNAGLNLYNLWQKGYRNLSGVEINPVAIQLMRETFPEMEVQIRVGSIELYIRTLSAGLIFTKAVLCHIHPKSEWIFEEIANRAKYIITVENERAGRKNGRHFPRNYQKVFESLGKKQIYYKEDVEGMADAYVLRMFA